MSDYDYFDIDKKYEAMIEEFAEVLIKRTLKESLDEDIYNLDRLCLKIIKKHMKYIYCDVLEDIEQKIVYILENEYNISI